jgi:drug/metabolite transporter (DMT)-like permease
MSRAAAGPSSRDEGLRATDADLLVARADLSTQQQSVAMGVAIAVVSQLGWGFYPVLARSLLTHEPVMTMLELLVALNGVSACVLAVLVSVKHLLMRCHRIHSGQKLDNSSVPARTIMATASAGSRAAQLFVRLPRAAVVALFGLVISFRAITNLASAKFIPAHWHTMIALCTPVFTAAIGSFVFGDPLPAGTSLMLLAGLCGSSLTVWGGRSGSSESGRGSSDGVYGSGESDGGGEDSMLVLGLCLAISSAIGLATYQHFVKHTKGLLTGNFVLALNYAVVLVPCGSLLALRQAHGEGDLFGTLATLGPRGWGVLTALSLGVDLGANFAQQLAIRRLGPTILAAVMPLRLVSSVVGSYVLLGESITSAVEAAGLLIVGVSAAAYLGHRVYTSRGLQVHAQRQGAQTTTQDAASARSDDPHHAAQVTHGRGSSSEVVSTRATVGFELNDNAIEALESSEGQSHGHSGTEAHTATETDSYSTTARA